MLYLILLFLALAFLLFALEAFVTPGFGVAGVGGVLCIVVSVVMTYMEFGASYTILAVLGSAVLFALFIWAMARSRALDRMKLKSTISSKSPTEAQLSVQAGDEGVATSRLTLIGNADIAGKSVEVKSEDGFIDEGTPIVVTRVDEALVLVKRR